MIKRKRNIISLTLTAVIALGIFGGCAKEPEVSTESSEEKVVNVYSARHYDVDKELFKKFEEETGIKVNLVEGKGDELIERLTREGDSSEADIILTVGAENIALLEEKGLIQNTSSEVIEDNIPDDFRGDNWVALTSRARVIAYNKDKVDPSTIKTYEDLTKEELKGKVLVRSSSSEYNIAMLASFIQEEGEEDTTKWAQGLVNNFARVPEGNDRDQAKAIVAGIGDVALINSYYVAKLITSSDPEEVKVGEKIGLIFPEDTHINISFGAITKSAKHKENAIKLLEFLTGEASQKAYTDNNGEYPLNEKVEPAELLKSWGEFDAQDLDFEELGNYKQKAVLISDQVGWK